MVKDSRKFIGRIFHKFLFWSDFSGMFTKAIHMIAQRFYITADRMPMVLKSLFLNS